MKEPNKGLVLNFYGPNYCNETAKYNLNVQLNCDKYAPKTSYSLDIDSLSDPCTKRVIINSKEACPKLSLGNLWQFFNKYSDGIAIIAIALGLYFLALGGRYH